MNIIEREIDLGPKLEVEETNRLKRLIQREGSLKELNELHCKNIRSGEIDYRNAALLDHLKKATTGRQSIDNPKYLPTISA